MALEAELIHAGKRAGGESGVFIPLPPPADKHKRVNSQLVTHTCPGGGAPLSVVSSPTAHALDQQ